MAIEVPLNSGNDRSRSDRRGRYGWINFSLRAFNRWFSPQTKNNYIQQYENKDPGGLKPWAKGNISESTNLWTQDRFSLARIVSYAGVYHGQPLHSSTIRERWQRPA